MKYASAVVATLLLGFGAHGQADPQALFTQGNNLYQSGKYAEADSVLRLYLAQKGAVRDTLYADGATILAWALDVMGKYGVAENYHREALSIYSKVKGDSAPYLAYLMNNLASNLDAQSEYGEAELLYRRALPIINSPSDPSYSTLLNNLALNLSYQSRYTEADSIYRESVKIGKELLGEAHPDYATRLSNLGDNLVSQGRYKESEILFHESIMIRKAALGESNFEYATSLLGLGKNLDEQGQYALAEQYYRQTEKIIAELHGQSHPRYATALFNLGQNLRKQGRFAEAELLINKAAEIYEKTLGEHNPRYANTLSGQAFLLTIKGNYTEGELLYRKVLAINKLKLGETHSVYASNLNNLAQNLNEQGRYTEAEPLYRQALAIYKTTLGEGHSKYVLCLNLLAVNQYYQGRYTESESLHRQVLDIYAVSLSDKHPYFAYTLKYLSANLVAQQRLAEAELYSRQALEILSGHYTQNQETLSEPQRQQLYETGLGQSYRGLMARCAAQPQYATPPYAWGWHLNLRGLQLQTSARLQARVATSGDSTLQQCFATWRYQREYLAALYNLSKDELTRRRVDLGAEEAKATELERTLYGQSAAFQEARDTTRITWQQVAALLQPGQGVADIARYGDADSTAGYLVFLYRQGWVEPRTLVLKDATWLETAGLARYRRGVNSNNPDPLVYARFWAPLDSALGRVSKLYLAVDGVYNQVNVNTLRRPSGGYVLESTNVVQVGSFRDLVRPAQRPQTARAATVVGRPAYTLDSTAFEQQFVAANTQRGGVFHLTGVTFNDLPKTEQEARAIATLLNRKRWATTLHLGSEATEAQVKSVHQPRVLHIATHGFFVPNEEKRVRSFLRGPEVISLEGTEASAYQLERDPLLRSGVVLAGANNAAHDRRTLAEDGILTAYEASTLALQGTELVVLSACETGLGDVQAGEGIYGLQRSIQLAGARAVLTSLWRVDDAATQLLMTEFYTRWVRGESLRKAFTQAQTVVRRKHPEPYYWGAFVLVGE